MRYIPSSPEDRRQMLEVLGVASVEDLFAAIPQSVRLSRPLSLPPPLTEPELVRYFESRASRNRAGATCFLGAGAYPHYIPAVAGALASRSEFYTAYTPYQAEIAQGTLQAMFEFQTYITQLTGMDVANASLYDGGTALAEAVLMGHRINPRKRFLIARSVHPEYRAVVETYARRLELDIETVAFGEDGRVDPSHLASSLGSDVAGLVVQSPNFFGTIEDTGTIAEMVHSHGALSIVSVAEAISLGVVRPPGAEPARRRADIVSGEGQSFGIPMSFGGPHLGFIASREDYVRQLPGRLVGMGQDTEGHRAFVLTLATREQHIRRERATSNICTNQSLCALLATVYLAAVGPEGIREIATCNIMKLNYFLTKLAQDTAHRVRFSGPRFNEAVIMVSGDLESRLARLEERGIVAGLRLDRFFPDLGSDALLVCVTEMHGRTEIDGLVEGLA